MFICVDSIDQQKDFFLIGFNNFVDSLTVIVTSLLNEPALSHGHWCPEPPVSQGHTDQGALCACNFVGDKNIVVPWVHLFLLLDPGIK